MLLIYPPSSVPRTQNGRQKAALPHPQRLPPCHDGWAAMTSRSFALDQGTVAATASVQVENFFLLELRRWFFFLAQQSSSRSVHGGQTQQILRNLVRARPHSALHTRSPPLSHLPASPLAPPSHRSWPAHARVLWLLFACWRLPAHEEPRVARWRARTGGRRTYGRICMYASP